MLKNIPTLISPELMKTLMEMGHGDEIVFSDANYPSASKAQRMIRCDGHGIREMLNAILPFFPIDITVDYPITLMTIPKNLNLESQIQKDYENIINRYNNMKTKIKFEDKNDFYNKSKEAFAIVATGERERFANIILRKGIVPKD